MRRRIAARGLTCRRAAPSAPHLSPLRSGAAPGILPHRRPPRCILILYCRPAGTPIDRPLPYIVLLFSASYSLQLEVSQWLSLLASLSPPHLPSPIFLSSFPGPVKLSAFAFDGYFSDSTSSLIFTLYSKSASQISASVSLNLASMHAVRLGLIK